MYFRNLMVFGRFWSKLCLNNTFYYFVVCSKPFVLTIGCPICHILSDQPTLFILWFCDSLMSSHDRITNTATVSLCTGIRIVWPLCKWLKYPLESTTHEIWVLMVMPTEEQSHNELHSTSRLWHWFKVISSNYI